MPCGSFTVESESIGMGNVRIVHKVFLTGPTVNIQAAQLTNPRDAYMS